MVLTALTVLVSVVRIVRVHRATKQTDSVPVNLAIEGIHVTKVGILLFF